MRLRLVGTNMALSIDRATDQVELDQWLTMMLDTIQNLHVPKHSQGVGIGPRPAVPKI